MADLGWIVVTRWDEFQHGDATRTSGSLPWIKNYTRLMSDEDYLELAPGTVAILHRLWLVYASSRCRLRADTGSLTRRLGLRVSSAQLKALEQAGFITFSARKPHADGTQDARASRVGEEVEEEEEKTLDRSSRSEDNSDDPARLEESDNTHEQGNEPFALGPEPAPLNGTRDGYGPQPLGSDVEELARRWSSETA
jgi:hypothetical protein